MNIDDIVNACDFIGEHWTGDDGHLVREAARILRDCKAAGYVSPEGEVRKVLGTLPMTDDGYVIGINFEGHLHGLDYCGDIHRRWPSVAIENMDPNYRWFTTREAAEAARKAGEGGQ